MEIEFISNNINDTEKIAKTIQNKFLCKKHNILTLDGDLGSGKTTICKYLVQNFLNTNIDVISPTFNILNIYHNNNTYVYHYDFYRIEKDEELLELGLEEAFTKELTLIEWPNIAKKYLFQQEHTQVFITQQKKVRKIKVLSNKLFA